ncbi:hypothetical protein GE21DRAFT_1309618 [Neurospora crassa]|nr:hypothetical protein GE21DRAFT_1309618 [Neurospora crassa]
MQHMHALLPTYVCMDGFVLCMQDSIWIRTRIEILYSMWETGAQRDTDDVLALVVDVARKEEV